MRYVKVETLKENIFMYYRENSVLVLPFIGTKGLTVVPKLTSTYRVQISQPSS